ncbi:hypothetical protein GCM10010472_52090 [Pseudonocardia halophobica]|uniref:Uncharacterized protein n=1 Tax=Pseudonocardia halophobica TaxID=29401 RepID=A0A9W6L3C2_9PSEU|nr:hypothetical protein [Pseudonocardia halophobica]GLL11345.1 hypothetical protein GCM10017577_24860 [Pseudonocardia halophobica]
MSLHVLYVDPASEAARWMDIPGADHENPPVSLEYLSTESPDPLRAGTYRRTGEQRDGRWVYRRVAE